jgi:hypothetical protein
LHDVTQAFGTDGRAAIMLKEDMKYDDGIVMEAVVEKFVKYFKSVHFITPAKEALLHGGTSGEGARTIHRCL